MLLTALVCAGIASLIHVMIFALESLLWTTPRGRSVFGTSAEEAAATRELAFNQGFYNLFLAVITVVGVVLLALGSIAAGAALVFAGAGSMLLAGLVLLITSPGKARPALIQLVPPLLAVGALLAALLSA
ncbi:DUF1304 domain-containing protein [Leucobacter sp. M11]|nr:DUF1304 domain-containing protein [Leucobacter sp. M11]